MTERADVLHGIASERQEPSRTPPWASSRFTSCSSPHGEVDATDNGPHRRTIPKESLVTEFTLHSLLLWAAHGGGGSRG